MINVKVNGVDNQFESPLSVETLIKTLEINRNGIAVAINHEVVLAKDWDNTVIQEQDNILIIQSTQGG